MALRSRVVVIIGVGGIGAAVARRLANGRLLFITDHSEAMLKEQFDLLQRSGHMVRAKQTNIADKDSVTRLANEASALGAVEAVIHTAGVSQASSNASQIYAVNLMGTAHVIDSFRSVMTPGSSMVCISSMAGHMAQLSSAGTQHFASSPTDRLLHCPDIDVDGDRKEKAYNISKMANIIRVRASAKAYGLRGARINTVSPGVISTPMGQDELSGSGGRAIRHMIESCPTRRIGTPDDIADVVSFLAGPGASFVTGTDILADGGVIATLGHQLSEQPVDVDIKSTV